MGERFIYVFSKEDKKKIESIGCKLYKSDDKNSIYIFIATKADIMRFDNENNHPDYILSDIISL